MKWKEAAVVWTRFRWKPMLIFTTACLLIGEQYPFSNFPMYSSFGSSTYYLYLADGMGAPVASLETIGMSTPTLKKVFSTEMRKERERLQIRAGELTPEQKQLVGERLLARLKNSPAARQRGGPKPEILRLYEVNISVRGGRFEKQTELVAESR